MDDAKEVMKNSDSMDKGIPGMNVDAINYMLKIINASAERNWLKVLSTGNF